MEVETQIWLILANIDWPFAVVVTALAGLLAAMVFMFRMKPTPREEISAARADPPIRKPGDPAFISRRARAAAAAMVLHRKRHSTGELDEKR